MELRQSKNNNNSSNINNINDGVVEPLNNNNSNRNNNNSSGSDGVSNLSIRHQLSTNRYDKSLTATQFEYHEGTTTPSINLSGFDTKFLVYPEQYVSGSIIDLNNSSGGNRLIPNPNQNLIVKKPVATATLQQILHKQQSQLVDVFRTARNKLQLIDTKHISFEYEVGRGKFGKVFKATWTDHSKKRGHGKQRVIAVKWFKKNEVDQETFADFLKEISVAAHLPPHNNVVQIYGFCIAPYALVTEYISGGSVSIAVSILPRNLSRSIRNSLTLIDIIQMFIDSARGISHLHTVGIIHRDIAARNLLLDDVRPSHKSNKSIKPHLSLSRTSYNKSKHIKQYRRVVVCDFGLSRVVNNPDGDNITGSNTGPIKWMSPESIREHKYNSKTDVYSFGILMWEILCGMCPYPDTKMLLVAVDVLRKHIRPRILEWFPRQVSILMQRCWQHIPEYRPTFEEIINELIIYKKQLLMKENSSLKLMKLVNILPNELTITKEPLMTLDDLCNNYLHEDKYTWDAMLKPKLLNSIKKYNQKLLNVTINNV